jgi:hypothetical protein
MILFFLHKDLNSSSIQIYGNLESKSSKTIFVFLNILSMFVMYFLVRLSLFLGK